MKRTTVFLTDRQAERLEALRGETDLPPAEHIRRAVDFYLEFRERFERLEAMVAELYEMHTPGR